jgi:hypothetical protein
MNRIFHTFCFKRAATLVNALTKLIVSLKEVPITIQLTGLLLNISCFVEALTGLLA